MKRVYLIPVNNVRTDEPTTQKPLVLTYDAQFPTYDTMPKMVLQAGPDGFYRVPDRLPIKVRHFHELNFRMVVRVGSVWYWVVKPDRWILSHETRRRLVGLVDDVALDLILEIVMEDVA